MSFAKLSCAPTLKDRKTAAGVFPNALFNLGADHLSRAMAPSPAAPIAAAPPIPIPAPAGGTSGPTAPRPPGNRLLAAAPPAGVKAAPVNPPATAVPPAVAA